MAFPFPGRCLTSETSSLPVSPRSNFPRRAIMLDVYVYLCLDSTLPSLEVNVSSRCCSHRAFVFRIVVRFVVRIVRSNLKRRIQNAPFPFSFPANTCFFSFWFPRFTNDSLTHSLPRRHKYDDDRRKDRLDNLMFEVGRFSRTQ